MAIKVHPCPCRNITAWSEFFDEWSCICFSLWRWECNSTKLSCWILQKIKFNTNKDCIILSTSPGCKCSCWYEHWTLNIEYCCLMCNIYEFSSDHILLLVILLVDLSHLILESPATSSACYFNKSIIMTFLSQPNVCRQAKNAFKFADNAIRILLTNYLT